MDRRLVVLLCAIGLSAPPWISAQAQECNEQKLASPNGPGIRVAKDCTREEGTFYNGRLWGQGKFTSWDGIVSEGRFIDGKLFGHGKVTYAKPDTRWLEGLFHDGVPSGPGRYRDEYGVIAEGLFYRGDLVGAAVLNFPNGGKLVGEFRPAVGGIESALAIYPDGTEEAGDARSLRTKLMTFKPATTAPAAKPALTTAGPAASAKPAEPVQQEPATDQVNKAVNVLRGVLGR